MRATFTNTKELLTIFNNISYISTTKPRREKKRLTTCSSTTYTPASVLC